MMKFEVPMAVAPHEQAIPDLMPAPSPAPVPVKGSLHIPPSRLTAQIHPLHQKITAEVDSYFLQHWPFPNEDARRKFVTAGFSRVTCLYFPMALDDRIHFACRLLTLLFLVDGKLASRTNQPASLVCIPWGLC